MAEISAYYQCYKNHKALDFVLSKFRNFYPESEVALVCDGGEDFSKKAEQYKCMYTYESKLNTESNLVFNNLNSFKTFIFRIKKYTSNFKSKYLLLLEDDVIVYNKISENDLVYDINGCNFNEFFNFNHQSLLKQYNSNLKTDDKIFFGGCGGSILNLDFFRKIFNNEERLNKDIEEFFNYAEPQNCASDRGLSYICLKNQGTIGQYKGFCETWHRDYEVRKQNNLIEVLHQYKDLYE